jgi:hypothetical protein
MPTYLPAVQGIQRSQAIAESMASATVGDPMLLTLELYHPSFVDDNGDPTAARIVCDFRNLAATLEADAPLNASEEVTFIGIPFRYTRQEMTDSGAPAGVQIEIDNVSLAITRLLAQMQGSLEPIRCIEREYLPSDTSAPHVLPVTTLYLSDVEVSAETVTAKVTFGDLTNRRFPVDEYTREQWPALAAG